jgi:hypothetical protein
MKGNEDEVVKRDIFGVLVELSGQLHVLKHVPLINNFKT